MRKFSLVIALVAILSTSCLFASEDAAKIAAPDVPTAPSTPPAAMTATGSNAPARAINNKACEDIAAACQAAGFQRGETSTKRFWQDCMKPIILGQTVNGVTVNPTDIKDCREQKTSDLSKELIEMQSKTN